MLLTILKRRNFKCLPAGRLIYSVFDFVIVLKIGHSLVDALLEFIFIYKIARSEIFRNGIESNRSCRDNSCIPVAVVRNLFVKS